MIKLPENTELEVQVLGSLLNDQQNFDSVSDLFNVELFYQQNHKNIARAIISLKLENKHVDMITVLTWLKTNGLTEKDTPLQLSKITQNAFLTAERLQHKILELKQLYVRREMILSCNTVANMAIDDTCDIAELIATQEKSITNVMNKITVTKVAEAIDCQFELLNHIEKIKTLQGGELIGIDTGFNPLNGVTAGWQKSDLIILAARPGVGKSSFMLSSVRATLKAGKCALVFSLEMPKIQLYARICSQLTGIPLQKFLKYGLDPDEERLFKQDTASLMNSPLFLDDRGSVDINYIRSVSRKMQREKKIDVIFIDYLQLISQGKSSKSTNDLISEITRQLKSLAKELHVPVVVLSQLSREVERRPDKRPMLSDLRDSGAIEQDADMVIFLYRPEYYGVNDDGRGSSTIGKCELIIAKHRNGALGSMIIGFQSQTTNFYDIAS